MLHCCEAPRSMLSNYFCTKQVLRGTFGEIWRIQIQIYPKTYVELKYGAFYLNNEVSAHRLGLVVQLSWRVAPHLGDFGWESFFSPGSNFWQLFYVKNTKFNPQQKYMNHQPKWLPKSKKLAWNMIPLFPPCQWPPLCNNSLEEKPTQQ